MPILQAGLVNEEIYRFQFPTKGDISAFLDEYTNSRNVSIDWVQENRARLTTNKIRDFEVIFIVPDEVQLQPINYSSVPKQLRKLVNKYDGIIVH